MHFCYRFQADKDDLINDAAAIAESIQPKGNTLSSTNVVTPVPFLLRHTLREYQVSHLKMDILCAKFNGINVNCSCMMITLLPTI